MRLLVAIAGDRITRGQKLLIFGDHQIGVQFMAKMQTVHVLVFQREAGAGIRAVANPGAQPLTGRGSQLDIDRHPLIHGRFQSGRDDHLPKAVRIQKVQLGLPQLFIGKYVARFEG